MVELELERLRSQRFIQATYCTFALLAVATAVLFYTFYNALGIPAHEGQLIGQCFLVLAAGNLVVLSIWEFVWRR